MSADEPHGQAPGPELQQLFERQGHRALGLRDTNATERRLKLRALQDAILARRDAIYAACQADFAKPEFEIDLTEIAPVLAEIQHSSSKLARWMRGERASSNLLMFGSRTRVLAQPKGRSLIISPWNFPFNLSLMPLVSAVAAGCTAILKPSPLTPTCNKVLIDIVSAVFSDDEVAVCMGNDALGASLCRLPFDHIFFTGSPRNGQKLRQLASRHFASLTLELGGQSPAIVDESADIRKTVRNLLWGKFNNAGQSCLAPDHVYVHSRIKPAFIKTCKKVLQHYYGPDARDSADFARIIDEAHFSRLKKLLSEALDAGAHLDAGGSTDLAQRFIAPTVLSEVPQECSLMQEEIFGPILPVIAFDDLDELLLQLQAKPKPLALYAYGKNHENLQKIIRQTAAGGGSINQCVTQYLQLNAPFGGVGRSGLGQAHGYWGFLAFSHQRTVVENQFSLSHWLTPPYTGFGKRMLAIIMAALK